MVPAYAEMISLYAGMVPAYTEMIPAYTGMIPPYAFSWEFSKNLHFVINYSYKTGILKQGLFINFLSGYN
jgi:hypothetical protein